MTSNDYNRYRSETSKARDLMSAEELADEKRRADLKKDLSAGRRARNEARERRAKQRNRKQKD